ncbi:MAG: Asp-tRNA(Asn)/Glu-tRNA(Gln) amidotransferase subunit GatB [Acidobacteria bacterium]|nr:Asp-tRNA(Asn)/Glu-tRNA(Gln) amidotransferase subunit GatB [Acidobacteriota bacterium]
MSKLETAPVIPDEVRNRYEAVIGLEVHVQLLARSKIFCACSTRFGDPPNSNTCPVCLGLPGALPVLNREAVTMAMKAAMALNCTINPRSRFARKNYFYPDLPKGYQISQYDEPLSEHGWIDIEVEGKSKRIGITRVHLEEDAGKSLHEGFPDSNEKSYIDLNRTGVPLIEIVSEPDLRSPGEAYEYLTRLKTIMLYLEVSDCNMEEGSLRVDANVSVRPVGASALGTKTEVKNLNSFRFLQKALAYEIERQIEIVDRGAEITQETRLYDSREGRTYGMRSKEFAHDYRYFPEPDLLPLVITDMWRDDVRRSMPELPEVRRQRFMRDYALAAYDAAQLTASKALADYFEDIVKASAQPKLAANWVLGELAYLLKEAGKEIEKSPVRAANLAGLLQLIEQETVSGKMGKDILAAMFSSGKTAREVMSSQGLEQINDTEKIAAVAREIISANPKQVEQYRSGKTATFGWFVGQLMKATRGQANPQLVQDVLKKELAG